MREIKFRAWHKKLEEYLSRDGRSWHHYGPNIVDGVLSSEDCTIEQFTGLHDKNGKEIYEGDIVKQWYGFDDVDWLYFKVVFGESPDCRWGFYIENYLAGSFRYVFEELLEVAGNIHENPELLEE